MWCSLRGLEVFYEERGEGRPLIALHGSPLDHHCCLPVLEPLFADRPGWRRIYPDLPGHGRTAAADRIETHDEMLEIVIGLLDALAPGERVAVAGFSYGALLARGLAHRRGGALAGLLLAVAHVAGAPLPSFRPRRVEAAFARALQPHEADKLDWVVWQTPEVLERLHASVDVGVAAADRDFMERLGEPRFSSFDVDKLPHPLEVPSLVVAGRSDHWCGYEGMFGQLGDYPLATYAVLDGGGHAAYVERPRLFEALVDDWLDRIDALSGQEQQHAQDLGRVSRDAESWRPR